MIHVSLRQVAEGIVRGNGGEGGGVPIFRLFFPKKIGFWEYEKALPSRTFIVVYMYLYLLMIILYLYLVMIISKMQVYLNIYTHRLVSDEWSKYPSTKYTYTYKHMLDIFVHTPLEAGMYEQQNGMCVCVGVKKMWCVKVVRWCVQVVRWIQVPTRKNTVCVCVRRPPCRDGPGRKYTVLGENT